MIQSFSGHQNYSLGSKQQNFEKPHLFGHLKEPEFLNYEYAGHQVDSKFQLSRSYGHGCRRGSKKNLRQR
jgi:hypothetical protein